MPPNTTMRAALARLPADRVAAQGVAGVDADADDVARLDSFEVDRLERLVAEHGIAETPAGVAAASTYSHRGVMTAVPKETSLGLIR